MLQCQPSKGWFQHIRDGETHDGRGHNRAEQKLGKLPTKELGFRKPEDPREIDPSQKSAGNLRLGGSAWGIL
jgi:hypothetical protein